MRTGRAAVLLWFVAAFCPGCGEEVVYVYSPRVPEKPAPRSFARIPPETAPRPEAAPEPVSAPARSGPRRGPHDAARTVPVTAAPSAPAPPGGDAVAATVNGEPVTYAELVDELVVRHGRSVLDDLIRTKAVMQEAAHRGVAVKEEEIDNEIARGRLAFKMKSGAPGTFEEMVRRRYGMSMEGYRGIVGRGLLMRKMILRRENPTDDEIMLWFYQNRDRYDVPAEITVSHIFVASEDPQTGTPRSQPWVRARLEKIRKALIRDEDFAALARLYSDDAPTRRKGGELGTVNERVAKLHLDPAFFEAMMVLKPGQAGGPVETRKGHHFIKVSARTDGRRVEYHEIRARVRVDYMEERAALLGETFLRSLMERAKVERRFEPPKLR